ncbi:NAD(P)H-dependent glycerol-3-phosphate dehydrogenase [Loigolactobacillus backii]|uniref:Glycerol-3-phosphate dehydrogenase [NAD(P)+] n=1 Tax=Loigolactobacillus backii TaxID=375175 RepID=A0A192H4Z3_9LACO|nr:NAD(P)H-dependent glycerol-3-phosphate dehydrogenase [Loigolactobacillus backii]ANK59976.1 glycerol-3-phosphate dehydrogenase [Loigolactobacillus backii]ANK63313.1 glycerol-3-phosphate dehydrogenase [Loigolactobacillus backii]ANK64910.1 glycerol-3-phosphate dehydrogenase [Loigolactobacillus backii]ANK66642.1 glycerol-3-phosphate dehydrogenase [Loigolactobacillus backii]ANK69682.1 glycerol-3-phosphate dehydrogenase [Loigolactobacillus backii]
MTEKIAVLGAGSWGTVLANLLTENGHQVSLWANKEKLVTEINQEHTNVHYLPTFKINPKVVATLSLATALQDVDLILFVVPTNAIREVAKKVVTVLNETGRKPLIMHASKGLEQGTHKRLSQVLSEEIPENERQALVVLSGPSHAEDVANRDLTSITAASVDLEAAKRVQQLFMNDYFRIYTNDDVIGVEMGAALKNVIAIGAGALHGLGYGDNTKAALITRGLAEISRLGVAFGAKPLTFIGLSGVGDLIVTCTSVHSRNWRAGNQLGQGQSLETILKNMGMVVEGVSTTKVAHELAQQKNIEMPITTAIYHVLYEQKNIRDEITCLMQREGKMEMD